MSPILFALAAAAQTAPAPVTVEIVALGHADTPANKFVLSVDINANGDTQDKAKATVAKIRADLVQRLAAVGATVTPDDTSATHAVKVDMMPDAGVVETDDNGKPAKPSASDSFSIQAPSRTAIAQAQAIIAKTDGASANQPPVSSIDDIGAATRAAKRDAIAKAKLDAQNYADALGYGGASVVGVSERGDIGTIFTTMTTAMGGARMGHARPTMFEPSYGDNVPTDVTVTVTFRLEGRK